MAKEIAIALNFTSKGEQKVIKNLQDLETELATLQKDLKTLDFGTPAFKEATTNINKLKSQIKDVDKATEGLETAQRFQAIGEAISIVVSGFQILTGIVGLFITNQEDLEKVQRAEATALNVLNVALGIQTLVYQQAELSAKGYSLQTIFATAQQKALTLATEIGTGVQKAFNAVLKANPVGLVVAGVVALTAAIYGLVKAYDFFFGSTAKLRAETEALNNTENDLIKTRIDASKTLENQLEILTDNISTLALEKRTIEDLKKQYAGFNAFVDENNKLTEEGIEFLKIMIKLKQDEAALTALAGRKAEKEIEFETKAAKIRQEYGASAKILIKELRERYDADFKAINSLQDRYTKSVNNSLEALEPYIETLDAKAEAERKAAEAAKQNTKVIDEQTESLKIRLQILTQIQERLRQVQNAELIFTDDILERQNNILELQNELLGERAEKLVQSSDAIEEIANLFFKSIPNEQQIIDTSDAIFTFFNSVRGNLRGVLLEGQFGFDRLLEIVKETGQLTESQIKILKDLPEETQASFVEFFNSYKGRIEQIRRITTGVVGVESLFGLSPNQIVEVLKNVETEQSKLFQDRIKNGLTELQILEKGRDLIRQSFGLNEKLFKLDIKIFDLKNRIEVSDADQRAILTERLNLLLQERTQIESIVDTILDGVVRNNKFVESIEKANKAWEKQEIQILKNKEAIDASFDTKQLQKFFAEYGEGLEDVLKILVLDTGAFLERFGKDGTEAIIRGVAQGLKSQGDLTRQEAERLIDIFERAAIGIKIAFGGTGGIFTEQIELLRKLLKGLPNELTPLQKSFQDIQQIAQAILGAFSDLSGRLQQIIQSNNQLLLDQLAQDEQRALESIGDATARARELREQEEKKYQKRRFEIEKRARLQELDFAIANALADSAGAIINALATIPPPASIIYAASLAALTGAQVQTIRNQRTSASAQQFVGRRGGLISGGSHEQGGVPALLEGGEFIVNREAVNRFGDTISDLNSATGGRRLAIDDSRLVQAISSQNMSSSPLKAYVLYNDIQSTEKLNKKITQLARL